MPLARPRSEEYLAAQGYVDTLREVVLTRRDTSRKYTPTKEAYQLPAVGVNLEGDRHAVSEIGSLSVKFLATDEFKVFLDGLTEPNKLSIEVRVYQQFRPQEKCEKWYGVLERLPSGEEVYPTKSITLDFVTPAGAWLDAGDVLNPATGDFYINSHVTDELLPALLEAAKDDAQFVYDLETPNVRGAAFWSGITRPKKYLADKNHAFDNTCRTTAICYGGGLLYIGVHDARATIPYSYPWIVSYDPATRVWRKVTRARYGGALSYLKPPTEWEFERLEYVGGTIYYSCRTNHPNLLDRQAHYHCRGSFAVAAAPTEVTLGDANLFTLHDRGQEIKSKFIHFSNRDRNGDPPNVDGTDYYGDLYAQMVGWGTPRHDVKECSVMWPATFRWSTLVAGTYIVYGSRVFRVNKRGGKDLDPKVGDYCIMRENNNDFRQAVGWITGIKDGGNYFEITVQHPSEFTYTGAQAWEIYFIDAVYLPADNVFLGKPQNVSVKYLYPKDVGSLDGEDILVERRKNDQHFEEFYWPAKVDEITEEGETYLDEIGYMSFAAIRDMGLTSEGAGNKHYFAGESAPFVITLAGYNPAFALSQGFYVASALQASEYGQPGPCRLMRNGAEVKLASGEVLKTYGDIFLHYDGDRVWVAWNDHEQDAYGVWFAQCKIGYWDGAAVRETWKDRGVNNYDTRPECYFSDFHRWRGHNYFGRIYNERNRLTTSLRIFFAAPPQTQGFHPRFYDCRLVATCAVKGDKSDILTDGALFWLADKEATIASTAPPKTYRIADVTVATRDFPGGGYTVPEEVPYVGDITYFTLIALDKPAPGKTHIQQISSEVLGKYIKLAFGRERKAEIARIVSSAWDVVKTATAAAGEPAEGGEVEYAQRQWQGEQAVIEYDENYPKMPRVKLANPWVVAASVVVTLKESGEVLAVDDLTTELEAAWYPSFAEPEASACYLHRRMGDDKNEAYLYFNGSLEGQAINIDYNYYINAVYATPIENNSELCFVEAGPRYKFVRTADGTHWRDDYSPRFGDTYLAAAVNAGDEIYGISSPSWLLVHYGQAWTGYVTVPVIGTDVPIWSIVGSLARAADCYCWESVGKVIMRRRDSFSGVSTFKNIMSITELGPINYKRVVLSYANGQVASGEGKPDLSLSTEYAFDKGHADAACARIREYYTTGRREFNVVCNGILDDVELLAAKIFEYEGEQITGIVVGATDNPNNTTSFKVSEAEVAGGFS